uniref:Glucosamine-6-phosphate isomerase ) n=1 Tax=Ganoderma boninense TaxID=34458 RepID=A0A5K1JS40_9APHY|nr:Glucosamine-6-phosphate isomerase (EC (Glucosamine-6-phosphate deaminase) [Ganoderma boninense]
MDLHILTVEPCSALAAQALVDTLARLCYKSIMMGKSSVYNATGRAPRGQKSVAIEYNIESVNLHNIIYVSLLARSALSDQEWTDVYGKFWKAENVVFSIMEIAFNFPEWHADLIRWWNRQIFGDDNELDSDTERDMMGSAFYMIMAQKNGDNDDNNNNNNINNNNEAPASGSTGALDGASK